MKKTFFLAGIASFLLSLAINAQQDSTKPMQQDTTKQMQQPAQSQPTTQPATQEQAQPTTTTATATTVEQKKYGNPTVDSILSKYTLVPMPSPITTEQTFPVIGQYQSSTNADQKITVTLDDQNKGFAWVEGLPQGKVVPQQVLTIDVAPSLLELCGAKPLENIDGHSWVKLVRGGDASWRKSRRCVSQSSTPIGKRTLAPMSVIMYS
jgi:hypothetical protein